ncbi:MAG TPA: decaprenylphospho-beta-D-erythro-pentofuranosid-2-ulose 2-reductase [Acidimicrobiaceae bacterium]|nr:decaprenylphospho-beta-D-erythro-pentofuranosid-2-ulose 2-reductase [Acidimicrobiaceae bacterium]
MRDAVGNIDSILVLGGSSEIAIETVRKLVAGRCRKVVLAVRTPANVEAVIAEFTKAGASAEAVAFDAADTAAHQALISEIFTTHGDFDCVLSAFGVLGVQEEMDDDPTMAADVAHVNFTGQVSALTACAAELTRQGHGTIVVLSSVAGERVRKDNPVYGATKAGLDAFAQGLGDRVRAAGVNVMIVRPGFVHTRMTDGLEEAPFATTAEAVAYDIVEGLRKGSRVVWSPGVLRWVFTVLRHLPGPVWRVVSNR